MKFANKTWVKFEYLSLTHIGITKIINGKTVICCIDSEGKPKIFPFELLKTLNIEITKLSFVKPKSDKKQEIKQNKPVIILSCTGEA